MCESKTLNHLMTVFLLVVGIAIVAMWPELRRYLRISQM
jgi:hypothetical protein